MTDPAYRPDQPLCAQGTPILVAMTGRDRTTRARSEAARLTACGLTCVIVSRDRIRERGEFTDTPNDEMAIADFAEETAEGLLLAGPAYGCHPVDVVILDHDHAQPSDIAYARDIAENTGVTLYIWDTDSAGDDQ